MRVCKNLRKRILKISLNSYLYCLDNSSPKKHARVLWNRELYEFEIIPSFQQTAIPKNGSSSAIRGDTPLEQFSRWTQQSASDAHLFKSTQLEATEWFANCLAGPSCAPPAAPSSSSTSPLLSLTTPKLAPAPSLAKDNPMPSPAANSKNAASAASPATGNVASATAAPAQQHFSSEWANIFFHRQYHPACAFQLELQWLVSSGYLLGELACVSTLIEAQNTDLIYEYIINCIHMLFYSYCAWALQVRTKWQQQLKANMSFSLLPIPVLAGSSSLALVSDPQQQPALARRPSALALENPLSGMSSPSSLVPSPPVGARLLARPPLASASRADGEQQQQKPQDPAADTTEMCVNPLRGEIFIEINRSSLRRHCAQALFSFPGEFRSHSVRYILRTYCTRTVLFVKIKYS